jgi:hypothetical protein
MDCVRKPNQTLNLNEPMHDVLSAFHGDRMKITGSTTTVLYPARAFYTTI